MFRSIFVFASLLLTLPLVRGDCATGLPFGVPAAFNAFVFGDFEGQSDVEGRLAAGGNVTLVDGFSVGDKLYDTNETCVTLSASNEWLFQLVSGGSVDWETGRLYYGSIAVGSMNDSDIGDIVVNGLPENCTVEEASPVDFASAKTTIENFSKDLHSCTSPTGEAFSLDEVLLFQGTHNCTMRQYRTHRT